MNKNIKIFVGLVILALSATIVFFLDSAVIKPRDVHDRNHINMMMVILTEHVAKNRMEFLHRGNRIDLKQGGLIVHDPKFSPMFIFPIVPTSTGVASSFAASIKSHKNCETFFDLFNESGLPMKIKKISLAWSGSNFREIITESIVGHDIANIKNVCHRITTQEHQILFTFEFIDFK